MRLKRYKFRDGDPGKGKGDSSTGFPTPADEVGEGEGELISSEVEYKIGDRYFNWGHVLAVDIDLPCHLIKTSPSKHHLIVEQPLDWSALERLLIALADANIIERGFAEASIKRQKTFLRIHPDTPLEVFGSDNGF